MSDSTVLLSVPRYQELERAEAAFQRLKAELEVMTKERDRLRDKKWEGIAALEQRAEVAELEREKEMLRLKACEEIADGTDGWELLRNVCPSTMSVATLRDQLTAMCLRRPYDCYWSRRAIAAEKETLALRAAVMKVTTQATLDHIAKQS